MLWSKSLKTKAEFELFGQYQEANGGVKSEINYLHQCRCVRVFYFTQNPKEWMGGYAISTNYKRYFEVLNPEDRTRIEQLYTPNKTAEVSSIWKNRKSKISAIVTFVIHLWSLLEAMFTKCEYIIGGTAHEKIRRDQMIIFQTMVFHDRVNFYGNPHEVWIYACRRHQLIPGVFRYLWTRLLKMTKRQLRQPVSTSMRME